jgi:hypothetical protein
MVDYSRQNLEWLNTYTSKSEIHQADSHVSDRFTSDSFTLETGDATEHAWTRPFTVVASETYLGRPLSSWPSTEKLQEIKGTCNVIIQKFMSNLASQIPSGTRLCLAIPAWQAPDGRIHHLSTLDQLDFLGYNRVSFSWASEQEMVYRRPDQLVARELLVITRK